MNQPFDEKLLTDLREPPPEAFANNLYQKLQQQELHSTMLQSTTPSSSMQKRRLYLSTTALKFAAGIAFVLFLSVLAVALGWGNSNSQNGVQVESIPNTLPSTTNSQNRLSLTEVQRFGTGSLQKLVWSPDNQRLAAISTTGIFIYHPNLELELHIETDAPVTNMQFNPVFDDTIALVQSGEITIMDNISRDNPIIRAINTPSSGSYTQVQWLPDGQRFVAANTDGTVDVISITDGELSQQVILENDPNAEIFGPPFMEAGVLSLDVNFDGTQLVTVGADAAVKVWSISEGGELSLLTEMTSEFPIFSYVTYAPNDGRLVVANDTLSIYNVDESGFTLLQNLALETPFNPYSSNVSFDTTGDYVFFDAGSPPSQRIWHLPTNTTRTLATTSEIEDAPLGMPVYSPDGSMMATLGGDKLLGLWNIYQVTDNSFLAEQVASATPVSGSFLHMAISSQNIVAAAQLDGTIMLFDSNTGQTLAEFNMEALPNDLTFSPDGNMLIIFGFDTTSFRGTFYTAEISSILSGTIIPKGAYRMLETGETYSGIAFNADQTVMLTGGTSLNFWDISNGVALQHPDYVELQETMFRNAELNSELDNKIYAVTFSPDGSFIAGMAGNILNVWDAQTGELRFSHYRRDFNQLILSFTADSQYIITSNTNTDPALRFWNLNGEEVTSIPIAEGYLHATISPDKSSFITVNSDGIQKWNIQDITAIGDPIDITPDNLTLDSSDFTSIQVTYSDDGQHLLFRWLDGTLRLFNIES